MQNNFYIYCYIILCLCFCLSLNTMPMNAQNDAYTYATIEQHRSHQKMLSTTDGNIAYIDIGQGEPILLLHGVPTSSWLYRHIINRLLKKGYRIIAPDMLGYGNSDKPKGIDLYNADQHAKRLLALMEHLNISEWTHVLHDVGGITTWEMLQIAPEKVKRLVVLNTIAYKEGFKPPMTFKRGKMMGKIYTGLYKSMARMMIKMTLNNGLCINELSKEDCKGYWKPMKEGGNRALYTFFTSFEEIDEKLPTYQAALEQLDVPAIVIWGERDDILVGEKQAPLVAKALKIADKDVHILKDAKHFIQEEQADEITRLIDDLMKR